MHYNQKSRLRKIFKYIITFQLKINNSQIRSVIKKKNFKKLFFLIFIKHSANILLSDKSTQLHYWFYPLLPSSKFPNYVYLYNSKFQFFWFYNFHSYFWSLRPVRFKRNIKLFVSIAVIKSIWSNCFWIVFEEYLHIDVPKFA